MPLSPIFDMGRISTPAADGSSSRVVTPSRLLAPFRVRTAMTMTSAIAAPVMKTFCPETSQPPSVGFALVVSAAASDPEPGSVRANAMRAPCSATRGSHVRFCSSVPRLAMAAAPRSHIEKKDCDTRRLCRARVSSSSVTSAALAAVPPYSSGTTSVLQPPWISAVMTSAGNTESRSMRSR
jgi:hypothetical protein